MNTIWVLVANQSEARIYSTTRVTGSLMLVKILTHEEGAAQARELTSDAPGRSFNRMGPARHGMEPDTGVKEEERRRFVREMVDQLEAGHLRGDFHDLVLLAAPGVLGVIRKTMSSDLEKGVIKEIPKNVIGQDLEKIQAQLQRSFALE